MRIPLRRERAPLPLGGARSFPLIPLRRDVPPVSQALWDKDPPLMQLPGVGRETAERCTAAGVEGVIDLIEMEDDARREALAMPDQKLAAVAAW